VKKKNELLKYLVGRFFLTLLLIWISQMIINLLIRFLIIPIMENTLGLQGFLAGKSMAETLRMVFSCLMIILIRIITGSGGILDRLLSNDIIAVIFGNDRIDSMSLINDSVEADKLSFYAVVVLIFLFALFVLWILPYLAGATIYARNVSYKVKEIEKARIDREKEYEKQRNLLLSDITHDIKTPITTIAGFSKALSDGNVPDDEQKEYLDAIYSKSMTVSNLVTLLFEYIKLDSKGYTLHKSRIDISEMLRTSIAGFYAEFENKNMELSLEIPDEEFYIEADKMQLERAVNNILSNTLAHNPEGTPVEITLFPEKKELVIRISDMGTRIEKEDAIHLFEPFVRGDKSRKSGTGNGLGLSITKKIVEMHGGRVYLIQYKDAEKYKKVKSFEIRLPYNEIKE